jgi:beta-lactamase regulating signal transducer with metallopeptidase domain
VIKALSYALCSGFAFSALAALLTAGAMRCATGLGGAAKHAIWFIVLVATVVATSAAFFVSLLRPDQQSSSAVIPARLPTPTGPHSAEVFRVLCAAFVGCWLFVSLLRLFLIARRIGALRSEKKRATLIHLDYDLPRRARLLASGVNVPSAVGFLHPAILLPETIAGLDPPDVRKIVLHEAAHLRRRDDMTGLVFLVCAAIFWFNPFICYIGKKLSLECEIACDQHVVEQTGDAARYAALLFAVAQSIAGDDPHRAWARFARRGDLAVRIRALMSDRTTRHHGLPRPALAALIAALLFGVGVVAFNAPALARTRMDASVQGRTMVGKRAAGNHGARDGSQRVRDFPLCSPNDVLSAQTAPGAER